MASTPTNVCPEEFFMSHAHPSAGSSGGTVPLLLDELELDEAPPHLDWSTPRVAARAGQTEAHAAVLEDPAGHSSGHISFNL